MKYSFSCARLVFSGITMFISTAAADATAVQAEHVNVELISEKGVLVPGQTAWLGLHLRHDPHWHSYWINPGDSGLPTRLIWSLPNGYAADPITWPAPSRFEVGGLYNFGYADEIVLPVAVHVPLSATPGRTATISVEAKWLVCREECITGKADLALELPIAMREDSGGNANAKLFSAARDATPVRVNWTGKAVLNGDHVEIRVDGAELPQVDALDVFAVQRRLLANAPPSIRKVGRSLFIVASKNDYFDKLPANLELVLTSRVTNGRSTAWQLDVPFVAEESSQ